MPSSERRRLRVVLDSNVWVSASVWGGLPARIVKAAEEGRIDALLSEEVLLEINRVLAYDRLRRLYEDAGLRKEDIIATIARIGKVTEVSTKLNVVQEDVSDNKFIECAVDGGANYIVSRDEHLLRLEKYGKIKVLPVQQFAGRFLRIPTIGSRKAVADTGTGRHGSRLRASSLIP
ncbi:MAG: putative toxin-antitoxin system toxin component, PIN family [Candidatus Bathyarchaeia archaeon]